MKHLEHLIHLRIYDILEWVTEIFGNYLLTSPYFQIDVKAWTITETFYHCFGLAEGWKLCILEEYQMVHYGLQIAHYYYALIDEKGKTRISFDNSPHYPHLNTHPHHKHFYPKERHRAVGFSGELQDALEEIKWILERK